MADLTERIEEAASAPAMVESDGVKVKEQTIADQIAADKYLSAKEAAASKTGGLRITRMRMPGARGGEPSC